MEKAQSYTDTLCANDHPETNEAAASNGMQIADQISVELEKVVGLDLKLLTSYVEGLGTLKNKELEAVLKNLKTRLGEKILPLLNIMAHQSQPTLAVAAIETLGMIQSLKAAQLLADLDEHHPEKTWRKAARKSLYKLKSVGIDVETAHKPLLGESKHQRYKALLSPIDGTGTQLIMLTQEMLAGDLHLLQVIASDETGIVECSARRGMTKKMFAKLPETFARQAGAQGIRLVETDYAYAMTLTLEAEKLTTTLPAGYESNKEFFEFTTAEPIPNPVFQKLDVENLKQQPYFLRTSDELFKHDIFLSWHLPLKDISEYVQELKAQQETVIELSPQFQQERQDAIYQKMVEAKIDAALLQRWQRRLEMMAYLFLEQGEEEDAKRALTAALTLPETPREQLKQHPFLHRALALGIEVAECVMKEGRDPATLESEDYYVARNAEGQIVVNFVEK